MVDIILQPKCFVFSICWQASRLCTAKQVKKNYGLRSDGGDRRRARGAGKLLCYENLFYFLDSVVAFFFLGLELRIHITSIVNLLAIKVTNISSSPDKNRRRHSSSQRRCNLFTIATKRTARRMKRDGENITVKIIQSAPNAICVLEFDVTSNEDFLC